MKFTSYLLLAALAGSLAACSDEPESAAPASAEAPTAPPAVPEPDLAGYLPQEVDRAAAVIDAEQLAAHIQTLASDEFGGRAPFTEGEAKTLDYLENAFRELCVAPGNGDSYRQPVSLVELTASVEPMTLTHGDESWQLTPGENMMAWTKRATEQTGLDNSELVFVGYGIIAPEYDWNDYEGLDVAGKTVVMLVNDPGYATQDENVFNGNAMTYYGRWTYKYEEAARQGAAGALIIHETGAAGYPWEVVTGSWAGAQFDLAAENDNMDRVKVEGWLSQEAARELFDRAGHDYDQVIPAAALPGFAPLPLNTTASVELSNQIRRSQSYNIVARIEGRERPDEHFVYMAHWDHMGTQSELEGDTIFNGAVDNATGTAALLELAQAYKALPNPPARSVLFLAVTAEESGLLGSAAYVADPIYPLAKTVGGINIDAMNVVGPTQDVVVIGYGSSELEEALAEAAARQNRELVREPTPEKGFFYRSDHFNFAKQGVPVLYAEGGVVDRERGRQFGLDAQADYIANRYHKPSDEFDPSWNLEGAVDDIEMYFRVGIDVVESDQWPQWYEGNEFRAIREQSRAGM